MPDLRAGRAAWHSRCPAGQEPPVELPFIRSLHDWALRLAAHPQAQVWMAIISFAEPSVFPIAAKLGPPVRRSSGIG